MEIGQSYSEKVKISEADVRAFADLSKDFNPLHLDCEYARTTIFERPICHGALVTASFSKILATNLPGPGTVYLSQESRFQKPIFWDEEFHVVVTVTEALGRDRFKLHTQVMKQDGSLAVDGIASDVIAHSRTV